MLKMSRVWAKINSNQEASNQKWSGELCWQEPGKDLYRERTEAKKDDWISYSLKPSWLFVIGCP